MKEVGDALASVAAQLNYSNQNFFLKQIYDF